MPEMSFDDLGASDRWRALPEQSDSLGLNREDLLARLNAAGIDAIFPMPSRIAEPEHVFTTPDLTSLADAVLNGDGG
jgi:hypothetical protein